ncbi:MAG: DUF1800 domain-containing protein [Acidobacteria bacterium]|nr:DUF1800 domain-containing protein [Acidobacteriota bacterium]
MKAALTCLILLAWVPAMTGAPVEVPNDDAAIAHALNRLAFGVRPGDVERIKSKGLGRWIDEQLRQEGVIDDALQSRLAKLTTLTLDASTIATDIYLPARRERRQRRQQASQMEPTDQPKSAQIASAARQDQRRVFAELAEAKLLRAIHSERQLEEVLVDFWFNHFNVFARKGQTEVYITEYERDAIRPRVFGTFRDLLGATAKSPAMLVYLDNWQSAAPNTAIQARTPGRTRGINENYARELLELHTLGVDGGYSQEDVVNVARAFTGWTVGRPGETGFRFAPAMHDRGAKKVLGQTLPANGGINDGERVLDIVAAHPATAKHIAFKLAQRFVSDDPPTTVVERAAHTFQSTSGNLREVIRTIVTSPEFFGKEHRLAKVKTPFEFVVSAMRATGAELRQPQRVVRALAEMGMPLYLCQPPTGYAETADAWVSSGALVNRINFAVALAPTQAQSIGSAEFQKQ